MKSIIEKGTDADDNGTILTTAPSEEKSKAKKNGSESETEKLPKPTGWRILVMPYDPPKTTKGGIELPDTVVERERVATVVGLVMDMGPLCYQDTAKFGPSTTLNREWCKKRRLGYFCQICWFTF